VKQSVQYIVETCWSEANRTTWWLRKQTMSDKNRWKKASLVCSSLSTFSPADSEHFVIPIMDGLHVPRLTHCYCIHL